MSTSFVQTQRSVCFCGIKLLFAFAAFGNFLFICVLVQRSHRKTSYSLYLLAIAIVNFLLIICIPPFDINSMNHINPSDSSLIWCKMQNYLFNSLLLLFRGYKIASCIDHATMCSRQAWIRSFSQTHIARRTISIITCVCLLIPLYSTMYFDIESNGCGSQSGIHTKFFNIYFTVINGWTLCIVMAICEIRSYINLEKVGNINC